MSIYAQARKLGFSVMGTLVPMEGKDPHCQYYVDSEGNTYIVRWGILTIVSSSGEVYC